MPPPAATAAPDSYAETLEEQLTEMICRMEGAGQARVMVTLAGSQLTRYAADTERSADTERLEHVLLGDAALVEQVEAPQILGVAVVCEGGGDPGVQYAVTELVTALTGNRGQPYHGHKDGRYILTVSYFDFFKGGMIR